MQRFSVKSTDVVGVQNYRSVVTLQPWPENADISHLRWVSEDSQVASVENGVITGVSVGETEVKVSDEKLGSTYTIHVQVVSNNTITSVEEAALSEVVVAPNPFVENLRIQSLSELVEEYSLLNVSGLVVREGKLVGSETVVVTADLPSGLYLLRLRAPNSASRTLRVVERES